MFGDFEDLETGEKFGGSNRGEDGKGQGLYKFCT